MATAKLTIKGYDDLKTPLKQAENELKGFESVAKKVGDTLKSAFTVLAIIEGIKKVTQAVNECVNAFKDQIEVETRLNAVIEATHQQYKYTTKDIKEYASALQDQTRFADDAIESAAQLLVATQKFDKEGLQRTLDLSADLAEAMGTDITSAASTLSKALIEPGEGLNRLKTIGLSFTDTEKELITQLRESGRELEAQSVILDKVEAAYGGVAKSIGSIDTSTLDKIKNTWSDLKEDLGSLFTTVLGPVFNWIYKTLKALERLANQVEQRTNFRYWLNEGNVNLLSQNFTTEWLNTELANRMPNYDKALKTLQNNNWLKYYLDRNNMTLEYFLKQNSETQIRFLEKWAGPGNEVASEINRLLVEYRKVATEVDVITAAIDKIEQDVLDSEQFAAQAAAEAATQAAVDAVNDVLSKYGSMSESYQAKLLEDKIASVQGVLATDNLDDFVRQCLQEILDNLVSQRQTVDEIVRGDLVSLALTGRIKGIDPLNTLFPALRYDTMSIMGGQSLGLGTGSDILELDNLFRKYASLSESYQTALLQDTVDRLAELISQYGDEDSPTAVYLGEILENLNVQLALAKKKPTSESSGSSNEGGLFQHLGEAMQNLEDAADTVWEDFKGQIGEAGDLINRLTSNMAQFGPILGAIVTALHYVIQGFVEEIGSVLEEFVYWGLEPLREFGRMIGEIITPILEEIMPSVIASGKSLMNLFGAIARVLTPIVTVLMKIIGPILTVLADVIVSIVGTISWAIDWIAYAVTWALNKITFGWVQQTANPGSLSDYVSNLMVTPGEGYESVSTTTGTNAAYSGMTNIYLNVYQNGTVVGEDGITEFALIIRNELADLAYYSR